MTATIDYSSDYTHWDNTEVVTLYSYSGQAESRIAISIAKRADLSRAQIQAAGVSLEGDEQGWWLPTALAGEVRRGDRIKDAAGVYWQIRSAVKRRIGSSATHWECVTVLEPE